MIVNVAADIKGIYTLPRTDLWPPQAGVTMIGDAAHLMAPNGEGVNNALANALDLATLLGDIAPKNSAKEWQEAIKPKMREYERVMHRRADKAFEDTSELLRIMYGENGAESLANMFKSFGMAGQEEVQEVMENTK
jgi:2-polyprenyl-6-methoxyphenol hydroxylase-like FAD-dependent oxidoreductase